MSRTTMYYYTVTAEEYIDGEYCGTTKREVIAPHCSVAAQKVEQEVGLYAIDAVRTGVVPASDD